LHVMRQEIQSGLPMVVLEPSCAAVFRDEMMNLFPTDKDAQRLSKQTFLLSEFLAHHAPGFKMPPVSGKVLLQGHCHHKSLMGMEDEKALLKDAGAQMDEPEQGCCGMAGAFGYEQGEHYDVSIGCGERHLLPAVRKAEEGTIILADGFSCREQIHQETDRHAMHLAEVLQRGLRGETRGRPEEAIERQRSRARWRANARTGATLVGLAAAGFVLWQMASHKRVRES
jgi:Fe-S oxidoreductase